jgi:hypothetical protein
MCLILLLISAVRCTLPPPEPWIVLVEENHVMRPAGRFSQVIQWSWSPDQCRFKPESWTRLEKWKGRRPDLITYTPEDPEVKARNWWNER